MLPRRRSRRSQSSIESQKRRERGEAIGHFVYGAAWLDWLFAHRLMSEAEIQLGQSESKADRRLYDLALRRATTLVIDEILAGKDFY